MLLKMEKREDYKYVFLFFVIWFIFSVFVLEKDVIVYLMILVFSIFFLGLFFEYYFCIELSK